MSYSSFEKDKKLMESWRKYSEGEKLNEEQVQLNVVEEERLDEEVLTASLLLMMKMATYVLYLAIGQREKVSQLVDNLAANDEVPPVVKKFFRKLMESLDAAAEAAPALDKAAKMGNSNWNPMSWKTNALMAAVVAWTKPSPAKPKDQKYLGKGQDPEWDGSELDEKTNKET